ncbi:unnamed protein product [Peniophora sp. CBMAI 1063]|nr:unnamed protein product [Peniophora sp. CBMAI 1063]
MSSASGSGQHAASGITLHSVQPSTTQSVDTGLLEARDKTVAAIIGAFKGDKSRLEALHILDGASEMTVQDWSRHYLARADQIDLLWRGETVSEGRAGILSGTTHSKPVESAGKTSSAASASRHFLSRSAASSRKRARSPEESDPEVVSDEVRPTKRRRKQNAFACGDVWDDMTGIERWEDFSKRHPIRSAHAWEVAYRRWRPDILRRVAEEVKKDSRPKNPQGSSKTSVS